MSRIIDGCRAFTRRSFAAGAGAVLTSPMAAHATDAPAKVDSLKYDETDEVLTVKVVDLSPRFLDFWQAAQGVADPGERFKIWKARYGFAAVPPTPEGDQMARNLLDAAWPKYEAALPVIRAGAKTMRPAPLAVLKSVAAVLKPTSPLTVQVTAYVGGFETNAFTYAVQGLPVVCVPIEMDPELRKFIFTHEMTHAAHIAIGHLSGGWERSIAATALQEGLAMQVTREAIPGQPIQTYVGGGAGWWEKAQANKATILSGALPFLETKDSATVFRFTLGQGTTGLQREAYVVGWFVVEQLRAGGMDLPAIARTPEGDMPALVRTAIGKILA